MSIDDASDEAHRDRDTPGSHVPRIVRMRQRLGGAANDDVRVDDATADTSEDDGLPAYAELHCLSDFSFLRGASSAEDLFERAKHCGYTALAITDECSLSGIVRAHQAADITGVHLIVGSEIRLDDGLRLVLLVENQAGYTQLCRLITTARLETKKGTYRLTRDELERDAFDDATTGLFALWLPGDRPQEDECLWLQRTFGPRAYLSVELHRDRDDAARLRALLDIAQRINVIPLASGDVHMATRRQRMLQDTVTSIRQGTPLAEAGAHLFRNGERHVRTRRAIGNIYPHVLLENAVDLASRCHFSMKQVKYTYPRELVPEGETPTTYLRRLTEAGMRKRWPEGVPPDVVERINDELVLIETLEYEAFFLTVEDIVRFAKEQKILCQGRGSSANSAVCYALGITVVNPAESRLLMARFLSLERKEPPDIDVDFEHQRREEVMQYVYNKYGRSRAALAATVIRYRGKSAVRDVAKAFGLPPDQIGLLAECYGWGNGDTPMEQRVREAGFDIDNPLIRRVLLVTELLRGRPRHLSQHVGGFVISDQPLWHLVPVENASMKDRTIIQWEKDDLEALELLKVDCLALGMLTCIRKAVELVERHRGYTIDLAQLPNDDPETFAMIQAADTVGVFQIESRAQMSMLPRLKPANYYDLVVEVAIVRPGPIQGDMVHPYLRRRQKKELVTYPSPEVKQILEPTLGIPLFQEQVMELVVLAAEYTPGEADEMRRSMAAWGRGGDMEPHRLRIRERMLKNNYAPEFIDQIFEQIKGFGAYGFPQSHAASFAKLVLISCWLKRHEPAAFACGLLNAQPMGFYSASQIMQDARRGFGDRVGVGFLPVDVVWSGWDNTLVDTALAVGALIPTPLPRAGKGLEADVISGVHVFAAPLPHAGEGGAQCQVRADASRSIPPSEQRDDAATTAAIARTRPQPDIRLGLRNVSGLPESIADTIVAARTQQPFRDIADLCLRASLDEKARRVLAEAGALRSLTDNRNDARWIVAGIERQRPLLPGSPDEDLLSLPAPGAGEEVLSDYRATGMTLAAHPLSLLRQTLRGKRMLDSNDLRGQRHGRSVYTAGIVTMRQKPQTASGTIFVTLEDEHGMVNVIVWPHVALRQRRALLHSTLLAVRGRWEQVDGVAHLIARDLQDMTPLLGGLRTETRDFH